MSAPWDLYFVWQHQAYLSGEIDLTKPAEIFRGRVMPSTPQGDLVCQCPTGADALKVAAALNAGTFFIAPLDLPGVNGRPARFSAATRLPPRA